MLYKKQLIRGNEGGYRKDEEEKKKKKGKMSRRWVLEAPAVAHVEGKNPRKNSMKNLKNSGNKLNKLQYGSLHSLFECLAVDEKKVIITTMKAWGWGKMEANRECGQFQ